MGGYKHIIKKIRFMNVRAQFTGYTSTLLMSFDNVSITRRYLTKSKETVEQSEYEIDIAPTNISLWTVPGLKWFVVDKGKFNKQKCVQRCAKLFLCIPFGTKFGMASGI